jgi:hypothetical protein
MSEYQYYEFIAIDEPLTPKQMAELRACSSRANITPASFVNDYQWGDLKGDPVDWMRRYFDAHVYVANWCTCILFLRLPKSAFNAGILRDFKTETTLSFKQTKTHWPNSWKSMRIYWLPLDLLTRRVQNLAVRVMRNWMPGLPRFLK